MSGRVAARGRLVTGAGTGIGRATRDPPRRGGRGRRRDLANSRERRGNPAWSLPRRRAVTSRAGAGHRRPASVDLAVAAVVDQFRPHRHPLEQRRDRARAWPVRPRDDRRGLGAGSSVSTSPGRSTSAARRCRTFRRRVDREHGIDQLVRRLGERRGLHGDEGSRTPVHPFARPRLAPRAIRANAVCPGVIDTPLTDLFLAAADDPARCAETYEHVSPLLRMGTAREVAKCVLFPRPRTSRRSSPGRP